MKSTSCWYGTKLCCFSLNLCCILNVLNWYVFLIYYVRFFISFESHFISYSSSGTGCFQANSYVLSDVISSSWTLLISRSVEDHTVLIAPVLTSTFNMNTTGSVSGILLSRCMQGYLRLVWSVNLFLALDSMSKWFRKWELRSGLHWWNTNFLISYIMLRVIVSWTSSRIGKIFMIFLPLVEGTRYNWLFKSLIQIQMALHSVGGICALWSYGTFTITRLDSVISWQLFLCV